MDNMVKVFNYSAASRKRLICIPYAGGYSAAFKPLETELRGDWQVVSVDPPGHGSNPEPLLNNLEELVQLYLDRLRTYFKPPFVLFGHSMGGKIVHRMAQQLELAGVSPAAVIVSGCPAPDCPPAVYKDDQALLKHVASFGGIPEELLRYGPFIDYFLPILRADYDAIATYICPSEQRLKAPLHVFYGTEDSVFTREDAAAWLKWAERVEAAAFAGGHLFVQHQADELAGRIRIILNYVKEGIPTR